MKDQKQQLRKELARIRESISNKSNPDISERSKLICDMLLKDERVIEAKNILLYYPTLDEVDIRPVIDYCWEKEKNVYFPFIKEVKIGKADGMCDLRDYNSKFKEPNRSGPIVRVDLIVLPGLGFDIHGVRLGRGKGWYDKFIGLLKYRPFLIGVCFNEQLVKGIPYEKHDIRTDEVLTA